MDIIAGATSPPWIGLPVSTNCTAGHSVYPLTILSMGPTSHMRRTQVSPGTHLKFGRQSWCRPHSDGLTSKTGVSHVLAINRPLTVEEPTHGVSRHGQTMHVCTDAFIQTSMGRHYFTCQTQSYVSNEEYRPIFLSSGCCWCCCCCWWWWWAVVGSTSACALCLLRSAYCWRYARTAVTAACDRWDENVTGLMIVDTLVRCLRPSNVYNRKYRLSRSPNSSFLFVFLPRDAYA